MMPKNTATLQEITLLTQHELTTAREDDAIRECGRAALSLLPCNPELCLKLAYQKLHDVPYKDVKTCWRRLYTDASLWTVVSLVKEESQEELGAGVTNNGKQEQEDGTRSLEWVDKVVRSLDMTLILTGAPGREDVVELWFSALQDTLSFYDATAAESNPSEPGRPLKRRKTSSSCPASILPSNFPTNRPESHPTPQYPIPRANNPGLSAFQKRLDVIDTHTPLIMEKSIQHWPALEERPWSVPGYLLEQTLGGRRLVPVEIGKSYTDDGWGQRIISFREFMATYMLGAQSPEGLDQDNMAGVEGHIEGGMNLNQDDTTQETSQDKAKQTGYLAQHDLFAQIPSLRADISIPDYCYCEPAPSPHLTHIKPTSKLDEPLLNAWFGPAGTVSPLHTDPYHNILVQVVGYKYVRLYAPHQTAKLYPRSIDESGVDMSNTSQVDLDKGMAVWPEISCWKTQVEDADVDATELEETRKEFEERYPDFKKAEYVDSILGPGECLYLPVGWWHYIRSLTLSFSVSFWFN